MKIIHISDLHHASKRTNSSSIHKPISNLVQKIKDQYKSEVKKPLIILTGDILASDFRVKKSFRAKRELEKLKNDGFELLICPGNHDIKRAGIGPVTNGRRKFNNVFNSLITSGNIAGDSANSFYRFPMIHKIDNHYFIGLDSMQKQSGLGAKGELGRNQLNRLKKELEVIRANNAASKIIIYLHHSPLFHKRSLELIDREAFLDIINGVNVILFGHWHNNHRYTDKESEYSIDLFLNGGDSNISGIHWWEIDTDNFSIKKY